MLLGRIVHNPAFKKAWLVASVIIGLVSVLSGVFQATHGHDGGVAGILGGAVVLAIGAAGLWFLHDHRSTDA